METTVLNKPANELTTAELANLLAIKQQQEIDDRNGKREAYESLRDSSVLGMVKRAIELKSTLEAFKVAAYNDIDTLYCMLQEHSARHANGKGSVTLDTGDGLYRVVYKRHDATRFDERCTQAEQHILDFIESRYGNKTDEDSALIRKLLERKKGKLDKNRVLELISMKDNFNNENWRKGIELLQESIVPDYTKFYAQFFYRNQEKQWIPIVLDFAKLSAL